MFTYWPETIQAGESNALISQVDYYASLGSLLNIKLEEKEAIDSKNVKDALLKANAEARTILLEESLTLTLRSKQWKYIAPYNKKDRPKWLSNKKIEMGLSNKPQLFNLSNDLGEQNNVAENNKELVKEMQSKIDSIVKVK